MRFKRKLDLRPIDQFFLNEHFQLPTHAFKKIFFAKNINVMRFTYISSSEKT